MRDKLVASGEVNESVEQDNDSQTGVDDFLIEDKKAAKDTKGKSKSGRQSVAKSLRESIGFISTNKFGEGRRV